MAEEAGGSRKEGIDMRGKKTAAAMAMIAAIVLTGWAAGNAGAEEVGEIAAFH